MHDKLDDWCGTWKKLASSAEIRPVRATHPSPLR
eukprot:COSAG02_NODE_65831_length_257_cov_0.645570_1_plen_33_part_10